jgi:hypothetical protein
MPPRLLPSAVRPWTCPQCRTFTTSAPRHQLGPEHPNFIPLPVPPQQTLPHRPFIKGRLPVPRDVLAGAEGKDKASEEWLALATREPTRGTNPQPGSREEWKNKISAMRRRNMREGLASLRARRTREQRMTAERGEKNSRERAAALHKPELESERLTTPSHNLDLQHLLHERLTSGVHPDPNRTERIARMRANVAAHTAQRAEAKAQHLNTLHHYARHFIVTPAQLDLAVDEAFGKTPDDPVTFGMGHAYSGVGLGGAEEEGQSVWAQGPQERVQDLLNRVNGVGGRNALDGVASVSEINRRRVGRLAEVLTGGKMDEEGEGR